jgi:lipoate-protein ligase A
MAIDEALLTLVGEGQSTPTLRFYTWTQPWISLGSGQLSGEIDRAAAEVRGWGILRRASGGTAVLHQGQLGYALLLPADHPLWQGDLVASYERLSVPLQHAFEQLGALTEAWEPTRCKEFCAIAPSHYRRFCFGTLGPYELIWQDKKLIGNSQVRRRLSATQHGVIQVTGGQADLAAVLADLTSAEQAALAGYVTRKVGSLEEATGRAFTFEAVANALAAAFEESLGVTLRPGELSEAETRLADELVRAKYGNPEWTFRR